jgi:Domain of unknown function (DUF5615)
MMGRLYADEDFPWGAVQALCNWGNDVLTVHEAGRCGRPDPVVLADATADGRAVLTLNHRDYKRLHALGQPHGGIISCTRDDSDLCGLGAARPQCHFSRTKPGKPIHPNHPSQPSGTTVRKWHIH